MTPFLQSDDVPVPTRSVEALTGAVETAERRLTAYRDLVKHQQTKLQALRVQLIIAEEIRRRGNDDT